MAGAIGGFGGEEGLQMWGGVSFREVAVTAETVGSGILDVIDVCQREGSFISEWMDVFKYGSQRKIVPRYRGTHLSITNPLCAGSGRRH